MAGSDSGAANAAKLPGVIRALIYDFDDTIVESERINDRLFSELLRSEYGIPLSPGEQDTLYGYAWSGVFDWLEAHKGLSWPREQVWERFLARKREFLAGGRLRVAAGLERMLALPVPQAIVSGASREEIRMVMENIGMREDAVGFILSDDDCSRGKPDPQGYMLALERLHVDAREAVAFEDSRPGIQAARGAGIPVAFVAELASRNSGAGADMRFDSFIHAWELISTRLAPA